MAIERERERLANDSSKESQRRELQKAQEAREALARENLALSAKAKALEREREEIASLWRRLRAQLKAAEGGRKEDPLSPRTMERMRLLMKAALPGDREV